MHPSHLNEHYFYVDFGIQMFPIVFKIFCGITYFILNSHLPCEFKKLSRLIMLRYIILFSFVTFSHQFYFNVCSSTFYVF